MSWYFYTLSWKWVSRGAWLISWNVRQKKKKYPWARPRRVTAEKFQSCLFWLQRVNQLFSNILEKYPYCQILFLDLCIVSVCCYLNLTLASKMVYETVADPGFSPGGCANSQKCYYLSIFSQKLHETERISGPMGGARPWRPPPLDPPMWNEVKEVGTC